MKIYNDRKREFFNHIRAYAFKSGNLISAEYVCINNPNLTVHFLYDKTKEKKFKIRRLFNADVLEEVEVHNYALARRALRKYLEKNIDNDRFI